MVITWDRKNQVSTVVFEIKSRLSLLITKKCASGKSDMTKCQKRFHLTYAFKRNEQKCVRFCVYSFVFRIVFYIVFIWVLKFDCSDIKVWSILMIYVIFTQNNIIILKSCSFQISQNTQFQSGYVKEWI